MKKFKKIWRKLNIEDKTDILTNKFNLDILDINRIRRLNDGKKRLIEAAKLQFESFGNIHTDLTSWIAGYRSDRVVRDKFGSSLVLREQFIKFRNPYPHLKPSWSDIRNSIKLPNSMNERLAEEVGIHIGDGNLCKSLNSKGEASYKYRITGNLEDEQIYHGFIQQLMKSLYNYEGYQSIDEKKNSIQSIFGSKFIFNYKNKVLGLPIGSKKKIKIPKVIFKNDMYSKRCLVGIFDTDFNLDKDICINGKLSSIEVMSQIHSILKRLHINHIYKKFKDFAWLKIRREDSIKILEEWQMHNQKHVSKYFLWKEFGKFVPFTHTEERIAVLQGRLNLEGLQEISNKRKQEKKG